MSISQIKTVNDVDREIAIRERELQELRETKINMVRDVFTNSSEGQLAVFLHDNLCQYNHADVCDWHYAIHNGIHNWNTHAHAKWLNAAVNIINRASQHGRSTNETVRDVKDIIVILKACT